MTSARLALKGENQGWEGNLGKGDITATVYVCVWNIRRVFKTARDTNISLSIYSFSNSYLIVCVCVCLWLNAFSSLLRLSVLFFCFFFFFFFFLFLLFLLLLVPPVSSLLLRLSRAIFALFLLQVSPISLFLSPFSHADSEFAKRFRSCARDFERECTYIYNFDGGELGDSRKGTISVCHFFVDDVSHQ